LVVTIVALFWLSVYVMMMTVFRRMPAWRSPMTAQGNPFLGRFFDDPKAPSISPIPLTHVGKRRGGGDFFDLLQSSHGHKAIKMGTASQLQQQAAWPSLQSSTDATTTTTTLSPTSSPYNTTTCNALIPATAGYVTASNQQGSPLLPSDASTSTTGSTFVEQGNEYPTYSGAVAAATAGQGWFTQSNTASPVFSSCTTASTTSSTCSDTDYSGFGGGGGGGYIMGQQTYLPPASSCSASPPSFSPVIGGTMNMYTTAPTTPPLPYHHNTTTTFQCDSPGGIAGLNHDTLQRLVGQEVPAVHYTTICQNPTAAATDTTPDMSPVIASGGHNDFRLYDYNQLW